MRPFRPPMVAAVAALCLSACEPQESMEPLAPESVEDGQSPSQREAERKIGRAHV